MSFRDYLHEKAEESRHNETLAYLMFLAGAIFFVGGVLETLSLAENPEWLLFIPYFTEPYAGAVLGLALIISGFCLIIFGIAAGIHCSRDRTWYMQELRKSNSLEETMMGKKPAKTGRKKKSQKI
jgi:uncharacterized protein YneF (UPF0154 family)